MRAAMVKVVRETVICRNARLWLKCDLRVFWAFGERMARWKFRPIVRLGLILNDRFLSAQLLLGFR